MKGRIHWAWLILLSSFLTVFTYFSIRMSYTILMPEMILTLGITNTQAAVIASSFFVTYTALAPVLGFLMDRVSARRLIPSMGLLHGAGTWGMGTSSSFGEACFFFALVGAGSSAMYAPVMALTQRWFGLRYRGMALGILSVSWTLGYALMGLILPILVRRFQWPACWWILSAMAFGLVPINFVLVRSNPEDLGLRPWGEKISTPPGPQPAPAMQRLSIGQVLKLPNLWVLTISYFLAAFSVYIVATFIVTYAKMELQFPYSWAAGLASAIAFSGMAGGFFIPLLSDRWGRKRTLILNNLLLAASILPIPFAGNRWEFLFVAVCVFGFFFTGCWPTYAAAAGDFFPRTTTGSVLGVWAFFYGIGVMSGPAFGGFVADFSGTFRYSFYLASFISALGAIFLLWVKSASPGFGDSSSKGTPLH